MADGEPALDRALGTATILAGLKLDADSLRAALLLGVPVAGAFDADEIRERFGEDVATLVAGVARMGGIRATADGATKEERATQAENLRKMLLAMVEDIRVVLIKLAERTQALRALMGGDAQWRERTAQEVLDLFAPLANRLGVWQLKWELEDLSLRALEPATYKSIAKLLDERRLDRERYIEEAVDTLKKELADAGIAAEVTGRPKHIYSIWTKMQRKQAGIEALYDIRAVRILVDSVKDCYSALGLVHHRWTPLAREFDDYIAKPKANNYRSLHTAVIGPEGKPLEVQIRTREMHQHSEYGVASHWRYKEGGGKGGRHDPTFDEKIAWLRQVLDWKDTVADSSEWLAAFKESLFTDAIYVLTPQGKVIDLPRGATPVDFAYSVHTGLGHRCRGARVDGQMVPLNYQLSSGQQVEIVAAKQGGPSRDWLNADLGYVHSNRARSKVRQWFKAQQHEETVAQGRALVERELARLGRTALKLDAVAAKAGFDKTEDFFAAFARDDINSKQVQTAILALAQPQRSRCRACRARGRNAPESREGIRQRHPRRRRRPPAHRPCALLQAGAARCDRGLRDARQGRDDPSRDLQQRRAHARAAAGAADRRELGRSARRGVPGRHRGRGDGSAGAASRHLGSPVAREDQRHRSEHDHQEPALAHGVHDRGAEPRRTEACARLRPRRQGRAQRDTALRRLHARRAPAPQFGARS